MSFSLTLILFRETHRGKGIWSEQLLWMERVMASLISAQIVQYALEWLRTAVDLAQNEKFDCNLGFSHYSLNAVEVFSAKSWSKTKVLGGRREERSAAVSRWGAPGALCGGEVYSYRQAMRTTASLHFESAFAFNHVRDWDCIAKLLMSNTIGLPPWPGYGLHWNQSDVQKQS